MSDAAKRFYQRSHEADVARRAAAPPVIAEDELEGHRHRYSAALALLRARPGFEVLEMGYGGPDILATLAPLAARYTVADIVDRTEAVTLPANVATVVANLDDPFPFPDASFDAVIAMMVIEHLYDPFHAFAEVARVARPGAPILVNLPNIASLRCRFQLLAGRMPVTSGPDWFEGREWDGSHLHYFTVADVRRLGAVNGLELTHCRPVGRFAALKRLRPSLLCHEITYAFRKQ